MPIYLHQLLRIIILSVSEDRVLLDSASCIKIKNTEGSKERVEDSPSLDAHNYSEHSAESSVGSHEKGTQLLVSNDKSQGLFDATQVTSQSTLSNAVNNQFSDSNSQVIPAKTEYQSTKGAQSMISNKEDNPCEFRRDIKEILTSNSDSQVNPEPHTDWSRATRKKLLLLKAGNHRKFYYK